jgi:ribosome-associated toxin RatA of RatAB toxin-antitoxin module
LTAWAAEDLSVEAVRKGEFIEVRAQTTVDASLAVIWSTLTDYERLPEFIPGLKKSRVVSRKGATVVVEQSGEARFLVFSFPIDVTLESQERPPAAIHVRALSGTLRFFEGGYQIVPQSGGGKVLLRWEGSIIPDASFPPLIGEVVMRMRIEDQFIGMVREIERREALRRKERDASPK